MRHNWGVPQRNGKTGSWKTIEECRLNKPNEQKHKKKKKKKKTTKASL
jgi:hypothetical protein